jgi:hypothetical protein
MVCVYDLLSSKFTENLYFDSNNVIKISENLYLLLFKHPIIAYINEDDARYYGVDVELKYYTTDSFSVVITTDPELIVVEEAVFSRRHNCYIPKKRAVLSVYENDYIYDQDSVFSRYLCSYIFSRNCKMVWDNETKTYDWAPPELTIEVYQNGHYRTVLKDQVYEVNGTWYYRNGEVVW